MKPQTIQSSERYTNRLERALVLASQQISRLRAENVLLRAEAIRQCDITLGVVTRHIDQMTELQERGDELQLLVDATIEKACGDSYGSEVGYGDH
jgi:hypothetical protein